MSIWIAVVFFCAGSECAFWKAEELFKSKDRCENTLFAAMDKLESKGTEAAGACMNIKMAKI